MYITITKVKCAGCGEKRYFAPPGLRIKYNPRHNYQLLLACSPNCAQKFVNHNQVDTEPEPIVEPEPDVMITRNGAIPYRKITQTKSIM